MLHRKKYPFQVFRGSQVKMSASAAHKPLPSQQLQRVWCLCCSFFTAGHSVWTAAQDPPSPPSPPSLLYHNFSAYHSRQFPPIKKPLLPSSQHSLTRYLIHSSQAHTLSASDIHSSPDGQPQQHSVHATSSSVHLSPFLPSLISFLLSSPVFSAPPPYP